MSSCRYLGGLFSLTRMRGMIWTPRSSLYTEYSVHTFGLSREIVRVGSARQQQLCYCASSRLGRSSLLYCASDQLISVAPGVSLAGRGADESLSGSCDLVPPHTGFWHSSQLPLVTILEIFSRTTENGCV